MMIASSLELVVGDGMEKISSRAWKAILVSTLARKGEAIVLLDAESNVLFSNPRAGAILERLGNGATERHRLPPLLASTVKSFSDTGETTASSRVVPEHGHAIQIEITSLVGAPPVRTVLWLREDALRDERLYAALNERFGCSRRAFQLALLVRQGLKNRDIARELRLTEATVKAYLHDLYRACGVSSRTALIALIEQLRSQG